ncbi:putative late blight resistance protein homolog R1B-16 [Salvia hispanica]|uniref:putative late blight resistance protein homolog R1B-16 n=1 Tax=Salvia hispanica TaxID=49212 RepID=UPI002009D536|nr:putative late blight resistance protein homolog R1B-16 [Salvia hispanica]
MAEHVAGSKSLHHVHLLDESVSKDLLCRIMFEEEDCPGELQGVVAKIGSDCSGLPLAIHVIGGLLSKVERSRDVWERVSTDVKVSIVESDKHGDKSLEEEAEDYLKALVERNLLLVRQKKSNGKPMSYSIHDLLRDLYIRKTNEEKFLNVKNCMRRASVQSSHGMEDVRASPQLMSLARSFICTGKEIISPIFSIFKLVRVLDVMEMLFEEFPKDMLQLVNLRYIAFSCTSGVPIGISRLWNLQTLISRQEMMHSVPDEIWEMSELRHLWLVTLIEIGKGYKIRFVHKKLQMIYFVRITPSLIRNGFFEIIPNIRSLGIYYLDSPDVEVDLSHLHKLKNLKCFSVLTKDGSCFLNKLRFPCSIRKLVIIDCVVFRSFLTTLCALTNLEVLKIAYCVFERDGEAEEEEWEATEGDEFHSLEFLCLQSLNIVCWRDDETNFPKLRVLHVFRCNELVEIPCGIGDIPTLQEIGIRECGASVVASALQIQKVQREEYDNYDLKVIIED